MLDWDENYSFRIPASVKTHGGSSVIFFDLDNFIGHETAPKVETPVTYGEPLEETDNREEAKGIFFSADEEEGPQELKQIEEMENRLSRIADERRKHFGTPVFEHKGGVRLQEFTDEEWDLQAEAIPMDEEHLVDETVINSLRDGMEEALFTTYEKEAAKE